MFATVGRWGEVISKKFSGYITFFPKYEKNFPDIPKNFPDIIYFSRKLKKLSENDIDSSFQKCPLGNKCNLNDMFHARKGHFAPGKRAHGIVMFGLLCCGC